MSGLRHSPAVYRSTAAPRVRSGSFSRVVERAVERVPRGFGGRLTVFKHLSVIGGPSPALTSHQATTVERQREERVVARRRSTEDTTASSTMNRRHQPESREPNKHS